MQHLSTKRVILFFWEVVDLQEYLIVNSIQLTQNFLKTWLRGLLRG